MFFCEKITGLVVEAAKRIQVNVPLKRYADFPAFRNVKEAIFPVFWADEVIRTYKFFSKGTNFWQLQFFDE